MPKAIALLETLAYLGLRENEMALQGTVKAYEFAGEIMADGHLKLPESALVQLAGHYARVIVLVP